MEVNERRGFLTSPRPLRGRDERSSLLELGDVAKRSLRVRGQALHLSRLRGCRVGKYATGWIVTI